MPIVSCVVPVLGSAIHFAGQRGEELMTSQGAYTQRPQWAGPPPDEASCSQLEQLPSPVSPPCAFRRSPAPSPAPVAAERVLAALKDPCAPLWNTHPDFAWLVDSRRAAARRAPVPPPRTCSMDDVLREDDDPNAARIARVQAAIEAAEAEDVEAVEELPEAIQEWSDDGVEDDKAEAICVGTSASRSCSPMLPTPKSMVGSVRLGKRNRYAREDEDCAEEDTKKASKKRHSQERFPCLYQDCMRTAGTDKDRQRHMDTHFFRVPGIKWGYKCPNYKVCGKHYGRPDEVQRHFKKYPHCVAVRKGPLVGYDNLWRLAVALPQLRAPPSGDPLEMVLEDLWEEHGIEPYTP